MCIDAIFRYCCFAEERDGSSNKSGGNEILNPELKSLKVQKVQFDEESYLAGAFVMLQVEGMLDKSKNEALCVRSNQPSVTYVSSDGARIVIAHETVNCTAKVVEEVSFDVEDGNQPDTTCEQNVNARKTRKMSLMLGDATANGVPIHA